MTTVTLKLTRPSPNGKPPQPPASAGPLFRGNGDTDYLCGDCGFVIAEGMRPGQKVIVDTATCPACEAENEFPREIRQ
jgi:hypothetical protein